MPCANLLFPSLVITFASHLCDYQISNFLISSKPYKPYKPSCLRPNPNANPNPNAGVLVPPIWSVILSPEPVILSSLSECWRPRSSFTACNL